MDKNQSHGEVLKRHHERLKKEELSKYTTFASTDQFRKTLGQRVDPLLEKKFETLSKTQESEVNAFLGRVAAQDENARRANQDPAAPDVDMRLLQDQRSHGESVLAQQHATELIDFRDTKISARENFGKNVAKGSLDSPSKSIDKSAPTRE